MTGISHIAVAAAITAALGLGAAASAQSYNEPRAGKRDKKAEAAAKAAAPKFSKGFLEAVGAPKKAGEPSAIDAEITAQNWPAATARIRATEAVAGRTPDDDYQIAIYKIRVGQGAKDDALLAEGSNAALASDKTPADLRGQLTRNVAAMALNRRDYPAAIAAFKRVAELTPNDPAAYSNLAQVYERSRQYPLAIANFKKAVEVTEAAGQKPEEGLYGSQLKIAYNNRAADPRLAAEIQPLAIALVRAYPNQRNWNQALFTLRGSAKLDDQTEIDLLRLLRASGGITGEGEYLDYASTAQLRGLPAEAKAVIDEGVAKGIVDAGKPTVKELRGLVPASKVASDKASLAALEREGRAAKTGRVARATADGYLSHGDWAKAADLYRVALAKGGEDTAVVNTRLGIALVRMGDKAGAKAAFAAVQGGPRASLAQYWMIWADQPA